MAATISVPDFMVWSRQARKGDNIVYWRGFVARDMASVSISSAAWSLYEAGSVLLFQRKLAPYEYEYIALSTGKPR